MKHILAVILAGYLLGGLTGCTASSLAPRESSAPVSSEARTDAIPGNLVTDRMLVWNAYINVEVADVGAAVGKASAIAEGFNGYVDQKSDNGEVSASMRLKVPSSSFKEAVKATQSLGDVNQTRVVGEDVTDQFVDVQARLKTKIELRDRLRQLLQKTTDIKDAIAVETELARVQGEIEAMEGRMKSLKGQVDYATINVNFERKKILGPIGLVFKGIWWGIGKLFVIQE